jgi:hypothetical protein
MNERYKELAKQATDDILGVKVLDQKKFAELIVLECAEIAKHNVMNISTYADAEFVDKCIKEHFSVE